MNLTRVEYSDPKEALVASNSGMGFLDPRGPPESLEVPKGAHSPIGVSLMIGNPGSVGRSEGTSPILLQGILANSSGTGQKDRLWVDWNQNKTLEPAEEAPLITSKTAAVRIFQPTDLPARLRDSKLLIFLLQDTLFARPGVSFEGELALGDRSVLIRLIDVDLDGKITPGTALSGDLIAIDYDADGKLKIPTMDTREYYDTELQPLAESLLMPDGKFYLPSVDADGMKLVFKQDPTPTGEVLLGPNFRGAGLLSRGDNYSLAIPIDRRWVLHSGSYAILHAEYTERSGDGQTWRLNIAGNAAVSSLRVVPGEPASLEGGGPFSLGARRTNNNGSESISVWLNDAKGNYISQVVHADGSPIPGPEVVVSNERGKSVFRGEARAWDGAFVANWLAPASAKGVFTAFVHWKFPLLGDLKTEVRFRR